MKKRHRVKDAASQAWKMAASAVSTLIVSVVHVISKPVLSARHFESSRELSPNGTAIFWEASRRRSKRPAKGFEITRYIKYEA